MSRTSTSRGWPLISKNAVRVPSGVGLADGEEFDDERFAWLDIDGDLFAFFHAEEELRSGEDVDVAVGGAGFGEFQEDFGVHQVAEDFVFGGFASDGCS